MNTDASQALKEIIKEKFLGTDNFEYLLPGDENQRNEGNLKTKLGMSAYNTLVYLDDALAKATALSDKHLQLYKLMCLWVEAKQKELSFEEYFKEKGYKKIAIYGMHYVGMALCEELKGTEIRIEYTLDRKLIRYGNIKNYTSFKNLTMVDAIIVTPITFYDSIKHVLEKEIACPIVSIKSVIEEILYK